MKESAKSMEFERAALLRDQIYELRATLADASDPDASGNGQASASRAAPGDAVAALAAQAAASREQRAARSPTRYGGGRRRR